MGRLVRLVAGDVKQLYHSADQLKRKLRQLKRLEVAVRFKNRPATDNRKLVWDSFFSTKTRDDAAVRYPLDQLLEMDRQGLKQVFEEYFCRVYFQNYKENGLAMADVYDPQLLSLLGLSPYASSQDIKRRYRELAKKYHPDHGGDAERFIELLGVYERLKGEQQ